MISDNPITIQEYINLNGININPDTNEVIIYARCSTNSEKQEKSIPGQIRNILSLLKRLGIDKNKVSFYEDKGKSGAKVSFLTSLSKRAKTPRKSYINLIEHIKQLKEPCYLFIQDTARLSRNYDDIGDIVKLLGINVIKKETIKIKAIFFISENFVWDCNTKEKDIYDITGSNKSYTDLCTLKEKQRRLGELRDGFYPFSTKPYGYDIKKVKSGENKGRNYLIKTKEAPYIKRAFEMYVEGIYTNKDIGVYLKEHIPQFGKWKLKNLSEFFKNPIYIGKYVDKNNEPFELKIEGGPIISPYLYSQAIAKLNGKKVKGYYGEKTKDDFIKTILRTPNGKKFTCYTPIGKKCKQYHNLANKARISFNTIKKEYLEQGIFDLFYKPISYIQYMSDKRQDEKMVNEYIEKGLITKEQGEKAIVKSYSYGNFKEFLENNKNFFFPIIECTKTKVDIIFRNSPHLSNLINEHRNINFYNDDRKEKIELVFNFLTENLKDKRPILFEYKEISQKKLKDLKIELELKKQERLKYKKSLLEANKLNDPDYKEILKELDDEIINLENEIKNYDEKNLNSNEIKKFSELFLKTVELLSFKDYNAINELSNEAFELLVKNTTVELIYNRNSSLKITLFDVFNLDKVIDGTPTRSRT